MYSRQINSLMKIMTWYFHLYLASMLFYDRHLILTFFTVAAIVAKKNEGAYNTVL
jgi:hypothetical protein